MTTEMMEVYSLEDGDTIYHGGNFYKYLGTSTAPNGGILVLLVDEEGYKKQITVPDDTARLRIVCDTDHNEYA